jgi:hypothetical protein
VEQELLILSEKMSSPKVLMGFILPDLEFPVSLGGWLGGGGANPPFHIGPLISRASGILKGPVVQKFYWSKGPVIFFLKSTPDIQTENFFGSLISMRLDPYPVS